MITIVIAIGIERKGNDLYDCDFTYSVWFRISGNFILTILTSVVNTIFLLIVHLFRFGMNLFF